MGQQDHEFFLLPSICLTSLPPICLCPPQPRVLSCPGWPHSPTGQTPEIRFLRHFSFWEPVYYRVNLNEPSSNVPSTSNEKKGYWVLFSDNVSDRLTWKILTEDTQHLIFRSAVRSANTTTPNRHHELPSRESNLPNSNPTSHEDSPDIPEQIFLWIQSERDDNSSLNPNCTPMAPFTVGDLIGRTIFTSIRSRHSR